MREWTAPEKADIIVSELLGSFGDNELSPECLDGAQHFLKGNGKPSLTWFVFGGFPQALQRQECISSLWDHTWAVSVTLYRFRKHSVFLFGHYLVFWLSPCPPIFCCALSEDGVSIPSSYTSFLAPLSSSKLYNEVRGSRERDKEPECHFETPYVVRLHNFHQLADPQPCFTFTHPTTGMTSYWLNHTWNVVKFNRKTEVRFRRKKSYQECPIYCLHWTFLQICKPSNVISLGTIPFYCKMFYLNGVLSESNPSLDSTHLHSTHKSTTFYHTSSYAMCISICHIPHGMQACRLWLLHISTESHLCLDWCIISLCLPPDMNNNRYQCLRFPVGCNSVLHGFAGYFETTLYKDVMLSKSKYPTLTPVNAVWRLSGPL